MAAKLHFSAVILALVVIPWHLQSYCQAAKKSGSRATSQPVASANKRKTAHDSQPEDEGDRIFQQNCSRCHWAPDGFSSRISGTIVRHMRVRASLSQHDEEELLRFLNP